MKRSDGNQLYEGFTPCICKYCGAFVEVADEKADQLEGEPLPSNATDGNWENPYVKETQRKIWF